MTAAPARSAAGGSLLRGRRVDDRRPERGGLRRCAPSPRTVVVGGHRVVGHRLVEGLRRLVAPDGGRCLRDDGVAVATYPVRMVQGVVEVGHR